MRTFSKTDLLLTILASSTIALVLGCIALRAARVSSATECTYNLKRISGAYGLYCQDHGAWITQISVQNGGTSELREDPASAFKHFTAFFKDSGSLGTLTCPKDIRKPVVAGAPLANSNISYFLSLSSFSSGADVIIAGTRNITTQQEVIATLVSYKSNNWNSAYKMHDANGYIAYQSGEVQKGNRVSAMIDKSNENNKVILP